MNAHVVPMGSPSKRHTIIKSRSRMTNRVMRKNLESGELQFSDGILQRHAARLLMFDDKVIFYKEEPGEFQIETGKETFTYQPDFEVWLDDGSVEYVEVKPLEYTVVPKTEKRLIAIGDFFEKKGFGFRVMTEVDICFSDSLLSNLTILEQVRRLKYYSPEKLKDRVPSCEMTFGELEAELGKKEMAYAMLAHKLVFCDLEKAICSKTTVSIKGGDQYAELY